MHLTKVTWFVDPTDGLSLRLFDRNSTWPHALPDRWRRTVLKVILPMSTHKNIGFETQQPSASGTSGCINQFQISIGRWPADQYEVPSDIPERLASLLEQLAEPTTNDS